MHPYIQDTRQHAWQRFTRQHPKQERQQSRLWVSILALCLPPLLSAGLSHVSGGMSNYVLWAFVGMVVGWGLMFEHGLVAIYFGSSWGIGIAGFIGGCFAEYCLHATSAVCVGVCLGVGLLWRLQSPETKSA